MGIADLEPWFSAMEHDGNFAGSTMSTEDPSICQTVFLTEHSGDICRLGIALELGS
ncbi:hypothetical protein [Pedobacter suwonensis]|uniref:hypothetical protein n=1 Tax=Pedobacter suwonensis TaxID=332999 RepID=UPI003681C2E0